MLYSTKYQKLKRSHYVNLQQNFSAYERFLFQEAILSMEVFLVGAVNAMVHTWGSY